MSLYFKKKDGISMHGNGIIGKNESFWSRKIRVASVVTISSSVMSSQWGSMK